MKKALLLVSVFAVTHVAQAETVQYQVQLAGSHSNFDTASSSTIGLSGSYFLTPLETTDAVQNELIFLRRANYISAGISHLEAKSDFTFDLGDGNSISGELESDALIGNLSGQFFVNKNTFIGGSYTGTSGDDGIAIQAGYYYGETSAVSASLAQVVGESDTTSLSVDTKSLLTLNETSSLAYGLGIGAVADDIEDSLSVSFNTTYYFTNHTGLGIFGGYHIDSSEFGYRLEFSHFFNDTFGLQVQLVEPDDGLDHYGASLIGRF